MHYDNYNLHCVISIHALLAESDVIEKVITFNPPVISIHALLAESDGGFVAGNWRLAIFLSTLSLRRATLNCSRNGFAILLFLSTLSLRRATKLVKSDTGKHLISIHALLAESDFIRVDKTQSAPNFYPRSPCGERRGSVRGISSGRAISIHALLAESDAVTTLEGGSLRDFYPRSPCGERRESQPPCARPTTISIHALLAESDHVKSRHKKHLT